jgi:hypothetical protein
MMMMMMVLITDCPGRDGCWSSAADVIQLACDCESVASFTNETVQLPSRVVLSSCAV